MPKATADNPAARAVVAGVDFGTDSVRVSVWDLAARHCLLTVARRYRRWAAGEHCRAEIQRFRQHPLDHLEALEGAFAEVADHLGSGSVAALGIDTTGSTPAPTDRHGRPLALLPEHADDPDCMFWLWKDHTATDAARRVDTRLTAQPTDFTRLQGRYSSEWWWAKILHAAETSASVREHAVSWVEHSDWLPALLCGVADVDSMARNSCAAGHKALVNGRLGMVPEDVLAQLHPHLATVARGYRLPPVPAGIALGRLCPEWARRLRLSPDTVIATGSLDAHAGAVGAGIVPGTLVKVIGTSAVDLFLTSYDAVDDRDTRSVCGIAEDSIVPGHLGAEAGQAAFGDLFAWYSRLLTWPWEVVLRRDLDGLAPPERIDAALDSARRELLPSLERAAADRDPSIVALDWINGRRYPDLDDTASAALLGLRIGHDAVDVYAALLRSAVLGARAIVDGFADFAGIERLVLVGGVAHRSPLICQALADTLGLDVMVSTEPETCAKGAAIFAAVALGAFDSIDAAQAALCEDFRADYRPTATGRATAERAYAAYRQAARSRSRTPETDERRDPR